jgi:hypothetical protein
MDAFLFVVARCATAQSGALRWRAHVNSLPGQHNHRVGAHVQNGSARVQRQVQPPLARSRIFAPPGHCNYEVALGFGIGFGLAHTLGMSTAIVVCACTCITHLALNFALEGGAITCWRWGLVHHVHRNASSLPSTNAEKTLTR